MKNCYPRIFAVAEFKYPSAGIPESKTANSVYRIKPEEFFLYLSYMKVIGRAEIYIYELSLALGSLEF